MFGLHWGKHMLPVYEENIFLQKIHLNIPRILSNTFDLIDLKF